MEYLRATTFRFRANTHTPTFEDAINEIVLAISPLAAK